MSSTEYVQDQRRVGRGFFPVVLGTDVHVEQGGGIVFLARQKLSVLQGGGQWFLSAGDAEIRQGGCAALVTKEAHVDNGFIGALVAGTVHLAPGARVLLQASPAVAAGAAVGFLTGWLVGRRRNART